MEQVPILLDALKEAREAIVKELAKAINCAREEKISKDKRKNVDQGTQAGQNVDQVQQTQFQTIPEVQQTQVQHRPQVQQTQFQTIPEVQQTQVQHRPQVGQNVNQDTQAVQNSHPSG